MCHRHIHICLPCRFIVEEDKAWFNNCLKSAIKQQVGEGFAEDMDNEPYFIDFLREVPEATTEEEAAKIDTNNPRIYEQVGHL